MRKKFTSALIGVCTALVISFFGNSCSKNLELPSGQGTPDSVYVETRISDLVSNFKTISVQVASAEIKNMNDETQKTLFRPIKIVSSGVLELQKLTIRDTILALSRFYTGSLLQLHLVFADNMKVAVKGTGNVYNVTLQKKDAYLILNQPLVKGCDYLISVNMNTSKSIVTAGVGKYEFNPDLVTATIKSVTGSISGIVNPVLSDPYVFAIFNGKDTLGGTLISPDGHFLLRGLIPGKYTVSFQPLSGYTPASISSTVTAGSTTNIGTVSLD